MTDSTIYLIIDAIISHKKVFVKTFCTLMSDNYILIICSFDLYYQVLRGERAGFYCSSAPMPALSDSRLVASALAAAAFFRSVSRAMRIDSP